MTRLLPIVPLGLPRQGGHQRRQTSMFSRAGLSAATGGNRPVERKLPVTLALRPFAAEVIWRQRRGRGAGVYLTAELAASGSIG